MDGSETPAREHAGEAGRHSLRLALVTGMSGAGRSTAARALEDLGWFVIDNMPPSLLQSAIDLARRTPDVERVGVVLDARGGAFFQQVAEVMATVPQEGVELRTVFLEASDEALVRRFESSRRPHPLQHGQRILDGLQAERALLGDLRANADIVIDTTTLNVHQLRHRIEEAFADDVPKTLTATVMSFGFKYGIPVDADLVADARFLPNPYWDEELRPLTGQDPRVSSHVLARPGAIDFLDTYERLVEIVSQGYLREGKRYVTVAVGCTGGKHRSVAMAEALAERLTAAGLTVSILHRDLGRE
ncbi:MAG: RNase adapter RapZ [Actinomycetales bacterium]|nr:RNase adapter RapZ [Actinomycetales bacterium]